MKTPEYIVMPSGAKVNPFLFDSMDFSIKDVASNLSGLNRFGGYVQWTVAQHSLLVENILNCNMFFKDKVNSLDNADHVRMYALLHDAPEAYLGDVMSPVKRYGVTTAYRDAELRIMEVIKNLLELKVSQSDIDLVHEADVLAMYAEATTLRPEHEGIWRMSYPDLYLKVKESEVSFIKGYRDNCTSSTVASNFHSRFFSLFNALHRKKPETTNRKE